MSESDHLLKLARVRGLTKSGIARSIRLGAGLSVREVASVAGVSPSTLWRWENQQRQPRGEAAVRYGRVLDELVMARR